jgi:hypothetical protein
VTEVNRKMPQRSDAPQRIARESLWLLTLIFTLIVTAVVATRHSARAEALANGHSAAGIGVMISYMLAWPGIATFFMILADGMYLERRFTSALLIRSTLGGALPFIINYGLVMLVGRLSYPLNTAAALTAIPVAVLFPIANFAFAIKGRWPYSKHS